MNVAKYTGDTNAALFNKVGVDKLTQGVLLKKDGTVYHVQIIETQALNKQKKLLDLLLVSVYTVSALSFSFFRDAKEQRQSDESHEENKSIPLVTELLTDCEVVTDPAEPLYFNRELTEKEKKVFNKHSTLMKPTVKPVDPLPPLPPSSQGWGRKEKGAAFVVMALMLSGAAYGAHRKGILPSRADVSKFLDQKKGDLTELWRSWRKPPEPTAPQA